MEGGGSFKVSYALSLHDEHVSKMSTVASKARRVSNSTIQLVGHVRSGLPGRQEGYYCTSAVIKIWMTNYSPIWWYSKMAKTLESFWRVPELAGFCVYLVMISWVELRPIFKGLVVFTWIETRFMTFTVRVYYPAGKTSIWFARLSMAQFLPLYNQVAALLQNMRSIFHPMF